MAEDFGFVHWTKKAVSAKIEEKEFEFSGINIGSLKDLAGSEINYEYEDSLKKVYSVDYKEKAFSTLIPGRFMLRYSARFSNVNLGAGLYKYLTRAHSLHYFLNFTQTINGFFWNSEIGYGGYSDAFTAGIGTGIIMGQKFGVRLSSSNILGIMLPQSVTENFYELSLKYQFG